MKKQSYESPLCEALYWVPENALLVGSPGAPGEPGDDLNELDPLNLLSSPFDMML